MKLTGVGPADRVNRVRALLDRVQPGHQIPHRTRPGEMIDPGASLAKLGMYVEKELYALEARLQAPGDLRAGEKTRVPLVEGQGEWRDLYGKPPRRGAPPETSSPGLFRPVPLNATNWALFCTERQESDVMSMMKAFHTVKAQLKMEIGEPLMCVTRRVQDYPAEMARVYEKSVHEGRKVMIFLVVLESSSEAVYKSIKSVMASKPVQTQCVQQRTIKPTGGIESKMKGLLQQMVCKLGGAPWALNQPPLMEKPTMVMGISVSHSKTGQHSVLALTATLDVGLTRYFSDVCFQAPGQTLASGIAESFDKALRAFASTNPNYPVGRIVVYRDDPGGRGALDALMENEIKPMEAILRQRSPQANLAVIVVRKRGLVRLFTKSSGNPLPGTTVDVGIVSREFNDFYLIAHSARMGTVKPTQYQIVYRTGTDDAFKAPNIQRVSYLLCHLYYNFMGTIAEPAPLRYADRLAGLTRQVLDNKGLPRAELSNTLFYL